MELSEFKSALREAFDAGRQQGMDETTAFEWGSSPGQTSENAFQDLLAEWNKPSTVHEILKSFGAFDTKEGQDGGHHG